MESLGVPITVVLSTNGGGTLSKGFLKQLYDFTGSEVYFKLKTNSCTISLTTLLEHYRVFLLSAL